MKDMNQQAQYLVFSLDEQHYALALSMVEKVIRAVEIIPLPKAPETLKGLINMKGSFIPVIDIRKQFHLPNREIDLDDRIVVARSSSHAVAFVVDKVMGLTDACIDQMDGSRRIYPEAEQYVEGLGEFNQNPFLVLRVDNLFGHHELKHLETGVGA